MFSRYKFIDGVLYIRVTSYTEFSNEFKNKSDANGTLKSNILNYLSECNVNEYIGDVIILVGNTPVGKISL